MKCALMISGLPRTMEFCFPSQKKHILDVYNPDVFICSVEQEEKFRELYDPVDIEIYSHEFIQSQFGERVAKYTHSQTQAWRDLAANWMLLRCSEMVKKRGEYDVIFSTRPDIKFLSVAQVGELEDNTVYAPRVDALHCLPDDRGLHFGGYSFQLCWGKSDVMHKLCQYYHLSDQIYDEAGLWHAEIIAKLLCEKLGIKRKMVEIDMMIIRGTLENLLSTNLKPLALFPEYNEE